MNKAEKTSALCNNSDNDRASGEAGKLNLRAWKKPTLYDLQLGDTEGKPLTLATETPTNSIGPS